MGCNIAFTNQWWEPVQVSLHAAALAQMCVFSEVRKCDSSTIPTFRKGLSSGRMKHKRFAPSSNASHHFSPFPYITHPNISVVVPSTTFHNRIFLFERDRTATPIKICKSLVLPSIKNMHNCILKSGASHLAIFSPFFLLSQGIAPALTSRAPLCSRLYARLRCEGVWRRKRRRGNSQGRAASSARQSQDWTLPLKTAGIVLTGAQIQR